jgi:DNA-binding winged helix-turn-helix (wHTH) protein
MSLNGKGMFRFGRYLLNAGSTALRRDGELILLPPRLFATLAILVQEQGEVVPRSN